MSYCSTIYMYLVYCTDPEYVTTNKHKIMCVCVGALRKVTGSASTSNQMLLLLWTMAIVSHRKGAQ